MADGPPHAGLSMDTLFDLAGKASKVKGRYDVYKGKYDKYKLRYDQVRGLLDADRRSDTLFDLGLEGLQNLLDGVLGEVPVSKLFWKSYAQHFASLKDVIAVAAVQNDVAVLQKRIIELAQVARRNADRMTAHYAAGGTLAEKFAAAADLVLVGFRLNRPLLVMANETMHRRAPTADDRAVQDYAKREILLLHRHYDDARASGEECLDDLLAQLAALTATRAGVVAAQARIRQRFAALKAGKTGLRRQLGAIMDAVASRDMEMAAIDGDIQDPDLGVDLQASMNVVGDLAAQWAARLDAWQDQLRAIGLSDEIARLMGG